MSWMSILAKKW